MAHVLWVQLCKSPHASEIEQAKWKPLPDSCIGERIILIIVTPFLFSH